VTGLTVPPGDVEALASALDELVSDEALRARLGAQAYQRVTTEFTVPRMVDRTLEVYHEAIRLHGSGAR
jgi:glycosyltransferase involved in cell wall biosynthesis